jgi:aminopeptidase N
MAARPPLIGPRHCANPFACKWPPTGIHYRQFASAWPRHPNAQHDGGSCGRAARRHGCGLLSASPAEADTYPRQPTVDAWHYIFRLELSDTRPEIVGEATIDLIARRDGVNEITLDLATPAAGKGMTVDGVTAEGRPIRFTHVDNRLTISPASSSRAGQHLMCTVSYHGIPANGLRLIANKYDEWSAFSENWPNRAREWLPMMDHPYDKATSEFLITAPARYQVVANGLLQEVRDLGDGRRLTHWKQSVSIASWLNAVGVEQFDVHYAGLVKGVELSTWVAHQDGEAGRIYFEGPARQALDFFSEHIGPYSYEKLANVAAAGINGGTEHASAIFYGERAVRAQPATALVAHEIAHQWFGNSITETDWDDVWLSEGFATYFTHLFTEHYSGRDAMIDGLLRDRNVVFTFEKANPTLAVVHDNLSDMTRVLNRLVYQKGAWVLHMLRAQLGTDTFWAGIREYYRTYRNGSATTADLERIMEHVSGQNLSWFFRQWLYRAGSPIVKGRWRYDAAARQVVIQLAQLQPGEPYLLPLEIGIAIDARPATPSPNPPAQRPGAAGPALRIERVQLSSREQSFTIYTMRSRSAIRTPIALYLPGGCSSAKSPSIRTCVFGSRRTAAGRLSTATDDQVRPDTVDGLSHRLGLRGRRHGDGVTSRRKRDVSVLRQAVVAAGQEQDAHGWTCPGQR